MANVLGLVLLLVAMAGVIAYTGDQLGSLVGKRRLSLFGVRPKQTGRIIGVLAGVAIMLVTVATLALAFRNAVRVIFNAQAVAAQLSQLQAETRNLESQRDALQRERDDLSDELQQAQDTIASAEAAVRQAVDERDRAESDLGVLRAEQRRLQQEIDRLQIRADELARQNQSLTSENDALLEQNAQFQTVNQGLREDIAEKSQQLDQLINQVTDLTAELETRAQDLAEAQSRLAAVTSEDLTYGLNEIVASGVLAASDPTAVREELARLLEEANEATARREAGPVELAPDQLESLVAEALQTPEADIVTLRSAGNHFGTQRVAVSVESAENRRLVLGGQLLISQQLHLGTPQLPAERERVRDALLRLQRDARDRLLALGLSEAVDPTLSEDSLEVDGFTNQLLRLSGPVTVGLSATSDIYGSGPARLEFVIVN